LLARRNFSCLAIIMSADRQVKAPVTRPFGFWTATALVVGGMIASGIFMIPATLAPFGWIGVVAWAVSIGGVLSIAFVLARLAQVMPEETGAIAITGAVLGELPGVLVGWSYWVSVWAANAAIAIAAASYLEKLQPGLAGTWAGGASLAVLIIWGLTLLNLGGARIAGRFQVVTTLLKLLPLVAVMAIAAGLWIGGKGTPPHAAGPALPGLAAAVALTLFPLVGFESAGVAAERVRDPARTIMRATMAGTLLTGLLYVVVCSAIIFNLPSGELTESQAPFQLFVERFWGAGAALAVAGFAAIAAIGALNGWILIQGEVPLGMARAGLLPAWFGRTSARDVPVGTLVVASTLASLLVLFNSSKSLAGVFAFAALLTTCAALWLYLAICLAALVRRVATPAAAIGLGFALFAFWGAGGKASGLSLLLMLTALPIYWLRPARSRSL
jgi:basic amino acid/polyamine antiporter, APA family